MPFLRALLSVVVFALMLVKSSAWADPAFLPAQGTPLLTVTGKISGVHGDQVVLDRASLAALPRRSFDTTTIWHDDIVTFEGVPISTVLKRLGVTDGTLRLTAANDYSIDIPVQEILENDPIMADRFNGIEMSLRDKGPLWLVYPYDSEPRFQTEVIFARSIWQLDRIDVRD